MEQAEIALRWVIVIGEDARAARALSTLSGARNVQVDSGKDTKKEFSVCRQSEMRFLECDACRRMFLAKLRNS